MITFKVPHDRVRGFLSAAWAFAPESDQADIQRMIDTVGSRGIAVEIKRVTKRHTDPQQGYYWRCLGIVAKEAGMSPEAFHDAVLVEAFGFETIEIGDHFYRRPLQRSSKVGVDDYSGLIETLLRIAAENFDCVLPTADPNWRAAR